MTSPAYKIRLARHALCDKTPGVRRIIDSLSDEAGPGWLIALESHLTSFRPRELYVLFHCVKVNYLMVVRFFPSGSDVRTCPDASDGS